MKPLVFFSSKTFDKDWTEEHRQLRAILTLETARIFSTRGLFLFNRAKRRVANNERNQQNSLQQQIKAEALDT
ncbi:MAG: hypothetical protein DRR08_27365 [Candidatus Parabeggiatoa sp. nov. 2]|nr:MAG: hypothetical protein DRR08_27365 [Gammaproteobacteria bacterium]